MKIACIGKNLGRISSVLVDRGAEFLRVDVTDPHWLEYMVSESNPDLIIYTPAITDVEYCENNPHEAIRVNVHGIDNLVNFYKGRVLFLSSDHVFSGKKWFGNGYSERHSPSPVNVYGMTKIAAEFIAVNGWSKTKIIRTSKVFNSADLMKGIDRLRFETPMEMTAIIKKSFLYVDHFVEGLLYAAHHFDDLHPILNIAGTDILSYADFWIMICSKLGVSTSLIQPRRYELKDVAPRPLRGGLNVSLAKSLGVPLYSALDGINEVIKYD